jgi:hypothetical protein
MFYISYMSYKRKTKKEICPDCGYWAIQFTPENSKKLLGIKGMFLIEGKQRSIEQIVNKIISEYKK